MVRDEPATERFTDHGVTIYDFGDSFLVRCPRCGKRALVAPPPAEAAQWEPLSMVMRLSCLHCGLARTFEGDEMHIGGCDWYFHLPLWLQTPCCGHVLWAYNARHLAFLESFVRATLRERIPDAGNRSLASRLPDWIKSGVHRADVLEGIGRLRALLEREE